MCTLLSLLQQRFWGRKLLSILLPLLRLCCLLLAHCWQILPGPEARDTEDTDLIQRTMTRLLAVTAMRPMVRYSSSITPRITLEGGG